MGWFIFAIIVWLAAIIVFIARFGAEKKERWIPTMISIVAVLIGFGLFAVGGMKTVPVKNIGIPQSFGKVESGVYGPGVHETWTPWLHLTDVAETVQTTTWEDSGNDSGSSCNGGLQVRIGGQQTACADLTIQWQINPRAAGSLFSDYAVSGNFMTEVTNAVVVRELKSVVNNVLGDYNPITDVQSVTGSSSSPSQFTTFSGTIENDMRADIGNRITIDAVLLPQLHYSSTLESKLEAIQQAYANDAVATENVKVNEENALALQKLGTPSASQLSAECLTDLKDGMQAPVGFQCFPGAASNVSVSSGG